MTDEELTTLEALAAAATKGPWKYFSAHHFVEVRVGEQCPIVQWMGFDDYNRSSFEHQANARFISAARTAVAALVDALRAERARVDALAKFKFYVHARLDAAGVPTDPESPHKAEGCRIGGRLDWVLGMLAAEHARREAAEAAIALLDLPLDFHGDEPTAEQLGWFKMGLNAQCARARAALAPPVADAGEGRGTK